MPCGRNEKDFKLSLSLLLLCKEIVSSFGREDASAREDDLDDGLEETENMEGIEMGFVWAVREDWTVEGLVFRMGVGAGVTSVEGVTSTSSASLYHFLRRV